MSDKTYLDFPVGSYVKINNTSEWDDNDDQGIGTVTGLAVNLVGEIILNICRIKRITSENAENFGWTQPDHLKGSDLYERQQVIHPSHLSHLTSQDKFI